MSTKATVLLALGQIWVLVMGTLAVGVIVKIRRIPEVLPATTRLLLHHGTWLLVVPLLWITLEMSSRHRAPNVLRRMEIGAMVGCALLFGMVFLVGHALWIPWPLVDVSVGSGD